MKTLVKSDVYNICKRIKNFDANYCLVWDSQLKIFQVYSTMPFSEVQYIQGAPLCYVCSLPYAELDWRTIRYLYDTRIDNIDDIINQIDNSNMQLEYNNNTKLKNQSLTIAENKLRQLTK